MKTAGTAKRIILEEESGFGPRLDFTSYHVPDGKQRRIPDRKGLIYIDIRIADKAGITIPSADNLLTFSVSGAAEIVAVDAGDPTSHVPFFSPECPAFNGLCSVIVRRTGPGPATLTVSSPGLRSAKIKL